MESSTVLAFRIFVMLSCLIIVPMAAIFGSAFPDVVKTVLVDRLVAWSTGNPPPPAQPQQPEGFREVAPAGALATGPTAAGEAPRWGAGDANAAAWQSQPGGSPSGVVPVGGLAQREAYNQSASFAAPAEPPTAYPPVHRVPAAGTGAGPAQPPGGNPLAEPDRFREIERKLRDYGATYYLLETGGSDGHQYRFHCRMAAGPDPGRTQMFEATDVDALAAMAKVVAQVEAWRAGR